MSTFSRKPEDETWYVHAPLKNEKRPIIHAPPPSSIPYLNGVMDTDEDFEKKQTIWFRESDSDFIKLSKLGGRTDLLVHKVKEAPKGPVPYPRPAWWTDMLTDQNEQQPKSSDKYVFEVPAWFAHVDKVKTSDNESKNVSINYPYSTSNTNNLYIARKHEGIDEPTKYGQIRNYLNPINIKSKNSINSHSVINSNPIMETRKNSSTTMPKLIANHYQNERPQNYEEWKEKNTNRTPKASFLLNK